MVKNLPAMPETQVQYLGWEYPHQEGMATHSSTLAWRIKWTEEPGGLQSMGSQRVGHDWATYTHTHTHTQTHTQRCFSICKWINVIHHVTKNDKNHMIIPIDAGKTFDKIHYPFMTKKMSYQSGQIGNKSQHNKKYLWQTKANIIPNGKTLKAFSLKYGTKKGCLVSPLLFNILLKVLTIVIKQEQEIKCIQVRKEEVKLSICRWHTIYRNP